MDGTLKRPGWQSIAKHGGMLLFLILGLLAIGYLFIHRQYRLDRELIAALAGHDVGRARALVLQGADPNTRYMPLPPPSLLQMWGRLIRNTPAPVNDSPTALDHSLRAAV